MEFNEYKKISLATDVIILAKDEYQRDDKRKTAQIGLQVYLIERKEDPFKGVLQIPGGFVDAEKEIMEAAKEKIYAKTGISNLYMEQLYTYDAINRDPRGRVISVVNLALLNKNGIAPTEGEWWWIIPKNDEKTGAIIDISVKNTKTEKVVNQFAFDHKVMLIDALNRLKNKVLWTDIVFNLLPTNFTVNEAKKTTEALYGEDIPDFRRRFKNMMKPTGIIQDDNSAYRPAELYTYQKAK